MSKNLLINTNDMSIFEPRRYYQEYEGTFITATNKSEDDTIDTDRFIEVTEIFGNTIQDENNLEDIQSIGELYVDEQGQPILDDLGREQYKVEIESCNNLFNLDNIVNNRNTNFIVKGDYIELNSTSAGYDNKHAYVPLKMYKDTCYSFDAIWNNAINWNHFAIYDENNQRVAYLNGDSPLHRTFIPSQTQVYKIMLGGTVGDLLPISSIQIYASSNKIDVGERKSHKTTILLPCQLQKVGDVYDRLYWDSEKGKYVVEKKIGEPIANKLYFLSYTFTSSDYISKAYQVSAVANTCNIYTGKNYLFVTDRYYPTSIDDLATGKCVGFGVRNGATYISVPNEELETIDFNGLEKWWNDNKSKIKMYVILYTPQLIETNITEKILLPCYEDKTHIFVNSTVDATMKVLVPYKEVI